ncbi:hypothetical protein J4Q44_G00094680 [Coregonus suidteri]|uniref:Uncharacterized protein n=1 Tax=Coregonus suidteri TaxID=861788 RepID=A0AAN8R137_9TELE
MNRPYSSKCSAPPPVKPIQTTPTQLHFREERDGKKEETTMSRPSQLEVLNSERGLCCCSLPAGGFKQ